MPLNSSGARNEHQITIAVIHDTLSRCKKASGALRQATNSLPPEGSERVAIPHNLVGCYIKPTAGYDGTTSIRCVFQIDRE